MANKTEGYVLHSAEHMFARSLQNLNLKINVIKADTFREDGRGFLVVEGKIPLDKLFEAEGKVNAEIPKNLKTSEEVFSDINLAKARYPNLRFNENRLKDTKNLRVVKIGDYDVCACKNKHVESTFEIVTFAIVDVSYLHGNTEIEFKASADALGYLMRINESVITISQEHNFKSLEIKNRYANLVKNSEEDDIELTRMFLAFIQKSQDKFIDMGDVKLSRFYKTINGFVKDNPQKSVVLLSKSQFLAARGPQNTSKLKPIGERLKEKKAFVGDVRDDFINGKVLDYSEAILVLDEMSVFIT